MNDPVMIKKHYGQRGGNEEGKMSLKPKSPGIKIGNHKSQDGSHTNEIEYDKYLFGDPEQRQGGLFGA
jgi:hypothetical protein